ncbi:MAG: cysteine desulfurase family protein [Anaerovoracaceae bacterium]|jgi:cysteine desulfurase|nr:cysteine desulfurase [Clostridiales bacterium]
MFVYLDNSATTKPYKEVIDVMVKYMQTYYGNPSSLHSMGLDAERAIKEARKIIANSIKAKDEEIYFTSGGTEADNMAIFGAAQARRRRGNKIITSKIEHPAVLETCKNLEVLGFKVEYIPVDCNGIIDLSALREALDEQTILISVMQINNELGSIQPITEIAEMKSNAEKKLKTEILLHIDAVQSFGKLPINVKDSSIDLITISGHKIHGPKGVGALYIRKGLNIKPYLYGGGQERGLRSGTENVPAIAGFGVAVDLYMKNFEKRMETIQSVRNYLEECICSEIKDIRINSPKDGSPAILNVSFLGVRGEVILHTLEQSNIYVSTGSACSSKKRGQSHVLEAIGLSNTEIEGAIRFSFSEFNTIEEMDYVLINLKNAVDKFRKLGSFR